MLTLSQPECCLSHKQNLLRIDVTKNVINRIPKYRTQIQPNTIRIAINVLNRLSEASKFMRKKALKKKNILVYLITCPNEQVRVCCFDEIPVFLWLVLTVA
jgi:hypothetical protein